MVHHFLEEGDRACREQQQRRGEQPTGETAGDGKGRDGAEDYGNEEIERIPDRCRRPNARRYTGQGEEESDLKSPEKVGHAERTEQKDAGEANKLLQKGARQEGCGIRRANCQILKRQTRARNQITHSSARMFQCVSRPSVKKMSLGKKIRCSLCCAKKSATPRVPSAIFSKSGAVPSHSSRTGKSTPFLKTRRPIRRGGARISTPLIKVVIDLGSIDLN